MGIRCRFFAATIPLVLWLGISTAVVPAAASTTEHGESAISIDVPGIVGPRDIPPSTVDLAFGADSAWVLSNQGVIRLDATSGRIKTDIPVRGFTDNVAYGDGHLWVESFVIDSTGLILTEVDPATNKIIRTVVVDGGPDGHGNGGTAGNNQSLAIEGNDIYLEFADRSGPTLATISAATGTVLSMRTEEPLPTFEPVNGTDQTLPHIGTLGVLENKGAIYAATMLGSVVWTTSVNHTHVNTLELTSYNANSGLPLGPSAPDNISLLAGGDGQLWGLQEAAFAARAMPVEISLSTGKILRRLESVDITSDDLAIAVGDGALWIVEPSNNKILRVAL